MNNKKIVHLQIDSGMNRLGIRTIEEYLEILKILRKCNNIEIEGIYTHFSSNYLENDYYNLQCSRFLDYLSYYNFKIVHTLRFQFLHNYL